MEWKDHSNPNCACVRYARVQVMAAVEDSNNPYGAFKSVRVRFVETGRIAQIMIPAGRAQVDQVLWVLGDKKNPNLPSHAFTEDEWRALIGGLVGEFVATLRPPADMAEAISRVEELDLSEVEAAVLEQYGLTPAAMAPIMANYRRHLTLVAASPEAIAVLDPEVDRCVHAHLALNGLWQHDMMQITGSVVFHVPCGDGNPADPESVRRTVLLYQQLDDPIPA